MTRKNRHRGQAYVEPVVYWIVYHPGKHEKKHSYGATYFEAFHEGVSSMWGGDKSRAIRFLSREHAKTTFEEATAGWKDYSYTNGFVIVPADEVTT